MENRLNHHLVLLETLTGTNKKNWSMMNTLKKKKSESLIKGN